MPSQAWLDSARKVRKDLSVLYALLGDYINEKKRLISFGKWMQVQICQVVNTHKQTTGEIVVVYEQRCGEKREGRGGTGACDTMWSNRVTEESTRQPRKRALGHARALVNLSLSLSLSLSGREIEKQCYCAGERGSEEREREYMMHALLHPTGHAMLQIGSSVQQAQV